jgi:hypothetical protein
MVLVIELVDKHIKSSWKIKKLSFQKSTISEMNTMDRMNRLVLLKKRLMNKKRHSIRNHKIKTKREKRMKMDRKRDNFYM